MSFIDTIDSYCNQNILSFVSFYNTVGISHKEKVFFCGFFSLIKKQFFTFEQQITGMSPVAEGSKSMTESVYLNTRNMYECNAFRHEVRSSDPLLKADSGKEKIRNLLSTSLPQISK